MRIIISATISADGYLNDSSSERLILSSPEDWREVYALRAQCDAILVGAGTLRADNPSLSIKDPELRAKRVAEGRPADIMKVVVSGRGQLDPAMRFFTEGDGEKVIFTKGAVSKELSDVATVISRPELSSIVMLMQLRKMGVNTLLIEGGSIVLSMFLREKSWDEFRLGVAPFFVGDNTAPRLVLDGEYPPMTLVGTENFGQTAVLHFENRSQYRRDCTHMARVIASSENSTADESRRYRVGAAILMPDGEVFDGYTGETDPTNHAEQEAIAKATKAGRDLAGATIYTTIEPCSTRKSQPASCSELIIRHGFARVVFGLREPDKFAKCNGAKMISDAGIEVVQMPAFAPEIAILNQIK